MKSFVSGRRIKRTLLSALVVRSLLFAVVAFVPTAVVTAYFQEKSVAVSFKRAARLLADGKASEINPILVQVEHSVSALEQRLLLTLDEEQFVFNESYRQDYLRESEVWFEDIARFTPGAATSWFRLEKERFGPTAGIFMTTDHYGGFVSVKPTNLADYAENDREHVGWYYEPLALGKPMWMHPYENKNVAIKMITYVIPLYRQGKFLGVVGMDIEMAYLKRFVDDIRWDDACAFLFDSDGNLMYHQDYPDGHPAIMFDAELAHLAESAMSGNTDTMYTWKWHEDTFHVVYARLQNGSVLALALSDGVARRARIQITVMRLFLLLVIACLLFFMGYFVVRRILTPISQLTESARRLSRGELGTVIAYHGDNEIGLLSHSLRMMEKQLKEYISYIRMQAESERKAKELALNASRAKSDFLANMSHEIRTPINAVLGMNEMILRENTDENIKGYAVNIRNAGNTLLSLINDILDFSKIEAGKMEIICARYDLALLLVDLMVLVGDRAEQKDLTLELKANPQIPKFLVGDSMRLKQCMLNILTNAVKYTEQGTVTFSVDFAPIDGDSSHILLKVSVRDTGIGIKKEDLERLFTPFERLEEERNRTIEGTGLGMNIVQRTLSMMGSSLSVESEYGKGSVFSFAVKQEIAEHVPLGDIRTAHQESLKSVESYHEQLYAPAARVLFVDDTPMNLLVVQGLLKHTGIQLDTADSGQAALEKVSANEYDMLFVDHRMPGMDGIETFHAMQQLAENKCKGKPCIALTANAISGAREMYLQEGFTDYLTKPVVPDELEKMIVRYLPPEKLQKAPATEPALGKDASGQADNVEPVADIPGIDMQAALLSCGSMELLRDMVALFCKSSEESAAALAAFVAAEDIDGYRIKVHALKSTAKLVGALELSEKARLLEEAADQGKKEQIVADTPVLLDLLRKTAAALAPFAKKDAGDEAAAEKTLLTAEELETLMATLEEASDHFETDTVDKTVAALSSYQLEEPFLSLFKEMQAAAEDMDYSKLSRMIADWKVERN